MRKKYVYVILTAILIMEFAVVYNLKQVKPAEATLLSECNYTPYINVTGEFENVDSTVIKFSFPLIIKDVYVKENMYVNKGQALFSVDKDRMTELLNGNIWDAAFSLTDIHAITGANSSLWNYTDFIKIPDTLYASESGMINRLNIKANDIVLPDQELISISSTDNTVAKLTLPQTDYGKIAIGNDVIITPIAFEKRKYYGKIKNDSAVVKKQSSLTGNKVVVEVFAEISNIDSIVSDGLQINGIVYTDNTNKIKTLDFTYIKQDDKGQYVYILRDGKAVKEYIETGLETNTNAQVLTYFKPNTIFLKGDIEEGDRIVLINDK